MRKAVFESHSFKVYNISIPERCLAPGIAVGSFLRLFDAFDGVVINELAYTFRSRGFLERVAGGKELESWAWTKDQVESASPEVDRSLFASFERKVFLFIHAAGTVALISAVTGLFIRVAVNGSAVLMFPAAAAMQACGSGLGRMSPRMLTRSFPWIGIHVELLREVGIPTWPLFRSHMVFLCLQSFAYLSCNLAWRLIIYKQSSPEGFEERIFSFCSALELFNLIFVRSFTSAMVFPKFAVACMVALVPTSWCIVSIITRSLLCAVIRLLIQRQRMRTHEPSICHCCRHLGAWNWHLCGPCSIHPHHQAHTQMRLCAALQMRS